MDGNTTLPRLRSKSSCRRRLVNYEEVELVKYDGNRDVRAGGLVHWRNNIEDEHNGPVRRRLLSNAREWLLEGRESLVVYPSNRALMLVDGCQTNLDV